jgi:hypothetical protein
MDAGALEDRQQAERFGLIDSPWVQSLAPRPIPEDRFALNNRNAQPEPAQ